jgi:hypothetical protein
MTVRARTVFLQALLVAIAIVVTALPARAAGAGTLDPVSSNLVFRSLFDTAKAASEAEEAQQRQQNPRHEGIGIGAKTGPLFSSFRGVENLDFENKTGWMGGIFFGGNRPGIVGVMGELMYAKKGAKQGVNETDIHYLEIPVLLRVNAGSNSLNGILGYFLIGPAFDINLKSKLNGIDIEDVYEDFDIGLVVGGGVEITRFIVEARGNWGLRKILKGDLGDAQKIKTRSFALLFGVRFN